MLANHVHHRSAKISVRGFLAVSGRTKNTYFTFRKEGKSRKSYLVRNLQKNHDEYNIWWNRRINFQCSCFVDYIVSRYIDIHVIRNKVLLWKYHLLMEQGFTCLNSECSTHLRDCLTTRNMVTITHFSHILAYIRIKISELTYKRYELLSHLIKYYTFFNK